MFFFNLLCASVYMKGKTLKRKLKLGFHCTRHFVSPFNCQELWEQNNTLHNITSLKTIKTTKYRMNTIGVANMYTWNATFKNNSAVMSALSVKCDDWTAVLSPNVLVWHHWSCRSTNISWQLQNFRLPHHNYEIGGSSSPSSSLSTVFTSHWVTQFLYGHSSFICIYKIWTLYRCLLNWLPPVFQPNLIIFLWVFLGRKHCFPEAVSYCCRGQWDTCSNHKVHTL